MDSRVIAVVGLSLLSSLVLWGQEFDRAGAAAKADLDQALQELAVLQQQIGEERIPLARQMKELEEQVTEKRQAYERQQRAYENQLVDLNVLKVEVKRRQDEMKFLESMLSEYGRVFETRIHISEVSRYQERIEKAKLAAGHADLTPAAQLQSQLELLKTALDRLGGLMGGETFAGRALTPRGTVEPGRFTLVGPVAVFASDQSEAAGVAELQLGSPEPSVIEVGEAFKPDIAAVTQFGGGRLPVDPTMGNALKISATHDTLVDHIKKGGPVMVPILLLGFAALIVAFYKWWEIARIRVVGSLELQSILNLINVGKRDQAAQNARAIKGPVGQMLASAIEVCHEKKEYIEEVMYEWMLTTKPKLERFLPMIALSAATAPLLGLLGTVTGMINTFNMITVFGTGDPKTLAGGISEALITTEFGLIVAVPSLLLHAFVSRKAKGVLNSMEQTTVGFINGVPTPRNETESALEAGASADLNYAGSVLK